MQAFTKFNRGLMRQSLGVRSWVLLLVIANGAVPLFYIAQVEAQATLVAFMAGSVLMTALTAASGFSRLVGLGHVLWIPLLVFLWTSLGAHPADDLFGFWLRAVMLLNAVSLVIDTVDVIRYLAGDRAETVPGL